MTKDRTGEWHESPTVRKPSGEVGRDYLVPQKEPSLPMTGGIWDRGSLTHLGQPQGLNQSIEGGRKLAHIVQRYPKCHQVD
jgi:hypothetical protein